MTVLNRIVVSFFLIITLTQASSTQAIGDVITFDNASMLQLYDTITSPEAVYSVAWSPDNNDLVFGLSDGTVLQQTILPLRASMPSLVGGHTDAVTGVDISADGLWAFSVAMDGTVRVWERRTGLMQSVPTMSRTTGDPFLLSVDAHPLSDNVFAYSGQLSPVNQFAWDGAITGIPDLVGHSNFVFDVEYSPDGLLLATGGADGTVRLWEYISGDPRGTDDTSHSERVYDVAFNRFGTWLVSTGQDRRIAIRPVLSPGEPGVFATIPDPTGDTVVNTIDVGYDDDIVAVGDSNGILRIYSLPAPAYSGGEILFEMDTGDDQIRDLAISPDGTMIATAGFDRTVKIWNVATPILGDPPVLPTLPAPPPPITGDYCTGAPLSRLAVGMRARVTFTDGTPLRVRSAPGDAIITEMVEGTSFTILGGPICLDGFTWWQLQLDDGTIGWSAEGDLSDYYIEPLSTTSATGATILGTVWHDICDNSGATVDFCRPMRDGTFVADGVRSAIEPVIPNVTVQLGDGACPVAIPTQETLTAPDGTYQFTGLSAGTYCVFVNPTYATNSTALIPGEWTYPLFLDPITGIAYQSIVLADGAISEAIEFGWDYQFAP